jgi:hypothetical protein
MSNPFFPDISKWVIPDDAWKTAFQEMASDGIKGTEGICLWLGQRRQSGIASITHCVLLRGPKITREPYNITIDPVLMREVHERAKEMELVLIGQIHSHAHDVGVDLSYVDRRYGIRVPGYLSIVAPSFCSIVNTGLQKCGVHVYTEKKGYVRLSPANIRKSIHIDPKGVNFVLEVA